MESPSKSGSTLRKYGRDYLLQLRMHPISLQKPQNLPSIEVVKDRLYFHQIDNISSQPTTEPPATYYTDRYHSMMKPEPYKHLHQQRTLPGYIPRSSYYHSNQKYNSTAPVSKYRSSTYSPPYYTPIQKQPYRATTAPYKAEISTEDFFENMPELQTAPWYKESFPVYTPENSWNINQKVFETKSSSSQQDVIHPKSKKKLPIIDPKTGKDILDGIETSTNSESSVESKENAEEEPSKESAQGETLENANKMVFLQADMNSYSDSPVNALPEEEISYFSASSKQSGDSAVQSLNQRESEEEFLKEYETGKNNLYGKSNAEGGDSDKNAYRNFNFTEAFASQEGSYTSSNMDFSVETNSEYVEGPVSFESKGQNNRSGKFSQAASKTFNETKYSTANQPENNEMNLKEKVLMLRDKMYNMKQEQQKMAIMQSFLRFKKHQLDETFRNLDEKKVDIVNWEYNLYTKAKKLHEKEHWLDTRNKNLLSKEKELDGREKWLNVKLKEMENKYNDLLSKKKEFEQDDVVGKNVADTLTQSENFIAKGDNSNAVTVKDVEDGNKNKDHNRNSERKDYSAGDVCKDKIASNKDKKKPFFDSRFKSDASSVFQMKSDATSEGRKYFTENIRYHLNRKDNMREFINKEARDVHSEGRKYFPEHIKFCLDHREKKRFDERENWNVNLDFKKNTNSCQENPGVVSLTQNIGDKTSIEQKNDSFITLRKSENSADSALKRRNSLPSEGREYFSESIKFYLNKKDKEKGDITSKRDGDGGYEKEMPSKDKHGEFQERYYSEKNNFAKKNISKDDFFIQEYKKLPSEGRKYFPEHLKFCLNLKEKNFDENTSERHLKNAPSNIDSYEPAEKDGTITSEGRKYLPEPIKFYLNRKNKTFEESTMQCDGQNIPSNIDAYENLNNDVITSEGRNYLTEQLNFYLNEKGKFVKENALENFAESVALNDATYEQFLTTSEGRKYLPENLKFYLSLKEKDVAESASERPCIQRAPLKNDHSSNLENTEKLTDSEIREYLSEKIEFDRNKKEKDNKEKALERDRQNDISNDEAFKDRQHLFDQMKLFLNQKEQNIKESTSERIVATNNDSHENAENEAKLITSEGRKYLPEQLKYYLNQKEKHSSESSLERDVPNVISKNVSRDSEENNQILVNLDGKKLLPEKMKFYLNQIAKTATENALQRTSSKINPKKKVLNDPKDANSAGWKYLPEQLKHYLNQKETNIGKSTSEHNTKTVGFRNVTFRKAENEKNSEEFTLERAVSRVSNDDVEQKNKPLTSEGRKYLPEHIAFYLNKKEKEVSEDISQHDNDFASSLEAEMMAETSDHKIAKEIADDTQEVIKKPILHLSGDGSDSQNLKRKEPYPSEGRKYLPEHVKFHLNQRDKANKETHSNVVGKSKELEVEKNKFKDVKSGTGNTFSTRKPYLSNDYPDTQTSKFARFSETPSSAKGAYKRSPVVSEGRKYFPEHVKYYLNYKERSNKISPQRGNNVCEVRREKRVRSLSKQEDGTTSSKPSAYGSGDIPDTKLASSTNKGYGELVSSTKTYPSEGRKYFSENIKYKLQQKETK